MRPLWWAHNAVVVDIVERNVTTYFLWVMFVFATFACMYFTVMSWKAQAY